MSLIGEIVDLALVSTFCNAANSHVDRYLVSFFFSLLLVENRDCASPVLSVGARGPGKKKKTRVDSVESLSLSRKLKVYFAFGEKQTQKAYRITES